MSATVIAALNAVRAQNFFVLFGFDIFGTTTIGCTDGGTAAVSIADSRTGSDGSSSAKPASVRTNKKTTIEAAAFIGFRSFLRGLARLPFWGGPSEGGCPLRGAI